MDIKVSIICNTYNHEEYVKDALDGFIKQKTTFPFEVLIHDDASTDHTADIIREYEQNHPEIIKPIYQTTNQFSQGVKITRDIQIPRARGKYLAFCEGDDYWTDENKLQIQYDILESHPNIDMCAHAAHVVNTRTNEEHDWILNTKHDTIIPIKDIIEGGGGFLPTASLMYRKEIEVNAPEYRNYYGIDYTLQVSGGRRGGIYYICKVMSTYRMLTPGSWTVRLRQDSSKKIKHKKKINNTMRLIDKDTNYRYHSYFSKTILKNKIIIGILRLYGLLGQ